jgi:hypothetical protein
MASVIDPSGNVAPVTGRRGGLLCHYSARSATGGLPAKGAAHLSAVARRRPEHSALDGIDARFT